MSQSNLLNLKAGDATVADMVDGVQKRTQTVTFSEFTDGGGASGTFDLTDTVPVGATFLYMAVTAVTGFTGDTTAVMIIGDGSDTDRYNTGTIDVFTTIANGIAAGDPSGTRYHATAGTVTLTVTGAADFTSIAAGSVTIEQYFLT